mgnify:CR=1 FL=1
MGTRFNRNSAEPNNRRKPPGAFQLNSPGIFRLKGKFKPFCYLVRNTMHFGTRQVSRIPTMFCSNLVTHHVIHHVECNICTHIHPMMQIDKNMTGRQLQPFEKIGLKTMQLEWQRISWFACTYYTIFPLWKSCDLAVLGQTRSIMPLSRLGQRKRSLSCNQLDFDLDHQGLWQIFPHKNIAAMSEWTRYQTKC